MGDFNLRDVNWNTLETKCRTSQTFVDTLKDNLLHQLVDKPTRGSNIIDLVIKGNPDIVDDVTVHEAFSTSDHSRTDLSIKMPVPKITLTERKIYL